MALARDIENRLAAVHQRNNRQCPQGIAVEAEDKASDRETGDTEEEIAKPQNGAGDSEVADPPNIGEDDAGTLSVADDRAKKSPATIISTISNGVSTAVPEIISPASKKSTWATLWMMDRNV